MYSFTLINSWNTFYFPHLVRLTSHLNFWDFILISCSKIISHSIKETEAASDSSNLSKYAFTLSCIHLSVIFWWNHIVLIAGWMNNNFSQRNVIGDAHIQYEYDSVLFPVNFRRIKYIKSINRSFYLFIFSTFFQIYPFTYLSTQSSQSIFQLLVAASFSC